MNLFRMALAVACLAAAPALLAQSKTCTAAAAGSAAAPPTTSNAQGGATLAPSYSVGYAPAPTDAVPPCSVLMPNQPADQPNPDTVREEAARAHAALVARQEQQLRDESAQLLQLVETFKTAVDQANANTLSADTARQAAQIEKLIKKIESDLKTKQ